MLTRAAVLEQLHRLAEVHSLPKQYPHDLERVAAIYFGVLSTPSAVYVGQLEAAVSAYLASDAAFFPKPGLLREMALKHARPSGMGATHREYRDWEATWGRRDVPGDLTFTPCPVCDVFPTWDCGVGGKQLGVRHVVARHRDAGILAIGWSDEADAFYGRPNPAPLQIVA